MTFALKADLRAVVYTAGADPEYRGIVTIPAGAVVRLGEGDLAAIAHTGMVPVAWKDALYLVFHVDLEDRGIPTNTGRAAGTA